jgi:Ca-activated chloride channel family protein
VTLGAPLALWGLAAVPALIVLYLLRVRRRDHPISSILLWQRSAPALAAYRPSRRIERSLLLVLQVLVVAAATLALARPSLTLRGGASGDVILVLDLSLSMRARDVPPTRFEAARADALALAARLRPGRRAAVIAAGPRPELVVPLTADRAAVRAGLARLAPLPAAGDVRGAVLLAAQIPLGSNGQIVVWTDAARGGLPAAPRIAYRVLGRSDDNVGITAFRLARDPRGAEALLRVENFSGRPRRVPLSVTHAGAAVYRTAVDLPAGAGRTLVFPAAAGGVYEARLDTHDALPDDDAASAVLDASPLPSALLVSGGNPYLERLLRVLPVGKAAVTRSTDPGTWAGFGVVVIDRLDSGPLPPGDYLLIRSIPPNLPVTATGEVRRPELAVWRRDDPVLRFVDLDGVGISTALALTTQGGRVLAGGDVPLIWAYEGGGIRAIVFAFALADTDLVERVAFPVLIANSLAWLGGEAPAARPGEPLQLPSGAAASAQLVDPDGRARTVPAVAGMFVLPPFVRAGVYQLHTPQATRLITVPPAPAPAGLIRPGSAPRAPRLPAEPAPPEAGAPATRVSMWPWALACGLAAAMGEWALATRRRGGDA